jgi:phytoene dehydrogenase-like protein
MRHPIVDVLVIGGGPNALVAGTLIARRRLTVVVLEQRPVVGGGAITTEFVPGFHAPTLAHALGPFRADLAKALKLEGAGLQIIRPDPALTALGADGQSIVIHRDPVFTAESINRLSQKDAGRWREFVDTMPRIASVLDRLNRHEAPSLDAVSKRDAWHLFAAGRRARALGRTDMARLLRWMPMAVADVAAEWFDTDLLQAAVAAHAIFGNFAGPWSPGTGGMLLQRLASDPMPVGSGITAVGGPGGLSRALETAARQAGVTIRTGARVVRIVTRGGRVTGVALDTGEEIAARAVVSGIDPKRTLLDLLDPMDLDPTIRERARRIRARGVTAKIHLALSALPEFPALLGDALPMRGRLLVAPGIDYLECAFDAAKYGAFSPAPWLDIAIPSVLDPALAPAGQHVMSIAVHAAPRHLRESTWSDERDALYRTVLDTLAPRAPGLESLIIGAEVITPEDLETRWGFPGGHIFHGEPALDQWWFARPLLGWANHRTPIKHLYLCSAGTHPGGGITGGSGQLAAMEVLRSLKKDKSR